MPPSIQPDDAMDDRPLDGTTIVSFESRMADETRRMIEKYGGRDIAAPSMQEVPLERHQDVFDFGERLVDGGVDALVLLTGVGTRMLIEMLKTRHEESVLFAAFRQVPIVARGPKPVRALKEFGLQADLKVPEPNTWREVLEAFDAGDRIGSIHGKHVSIQEYGQPNEELAAALRERGAEVEQVSIYRWELPDDVGPLKSGIRAIIEGRADVAMFTSRTQADHMFKVAESEGWTDELKEALRGITVASIGPVCTGGLRSHGIEPDVEPAHPKLGVLIQEIASGAGNRKGRRHVRL